MNFVALRIQPLTLELASAEKREDRLFYPATILWLSLGNLIIYYSFLPSSCFFSTKISGTIVINSRALVIHANGEISDVLFL